jgi:hypothetical protein
MQLILKSFATTIWHFFANFLFSKESSHKVAYFRIFFGVALLLVELLCLKDARAFFTDAGYFPTDVMQSWAGVNGFSLFFILKNPDLIVGLYYGLVLATILFIFGIASRTMSVIIFVLLLSFQQRDIFITNGSDRVLRIVAFYVMFLPVDQALVPAFVRKGRVLRDYVLGWPIRLIQVQIAILYVFAAISKLSYGDWLNGSYLFHMLNNPNYSYYNMHWLQNFPIVVDLMTYFVLFTELSAIFFLFNKKTRWFSLLCLFLLHFGIDLMSNVVYFSEVMFAVTFTFLDNEEFEIIRVFVKRVVSRIQAGWNRAGMPSRVVFKA